VGIEGGFKAKLQLYTVPGQVFYNSTRKLVLKGVDGIVFVADSQTPMLDANKESLQNLEANLKELGIELRDIPMVFQWNKRDLKNIVSLEDLERELNTRHLPSFHSIAQDGTGVFETLRGVTKLALAQIKSHHFNEPEPPKAPAALELGELDSGSILPPDAEALSLSDLPSSNDLLADLPPEAKAPLFRSPTVAPRPLAPQPVLRPVARTMVAPVMVSLTPLAIPKPKSAAVPLTSASALLSDLAPLNLSIPSVVKITLPASVDGTELEVVVQIRQRNQVIAEGQIKKQVPGKGAMSKISVELKRG
jgi:hypothetical protein